MPVLMQEQRSRKAPPRNAESHVPQPRGKKSFASFRDTTTVHDAGKYSYLQSCYKSKLTQDQLVILTGYPCSGLTYRAKQLASLIEKAQDELFASTEPGSPAPLKSRYKVHVVPSHDKSHPRIVYDHARTEKEARGVAYARAKRVLARDSIVILDGMNYIKGWRYQLWCEAKASNTTCCVVCT